MADRYDLGQEVFRWEMATAVAGSILGINPFDQPDVEASKIATRDLTCRVEREGSFPRETAFFSQGGVSLFADEENRRLPGQGSRARPHAGIHSQGLPGEFGPRGLLRDPGLSRDEPPSPRAASEVEAPGSGPTRGGHLSGLWSALSALDGQAYKGGPNSGVFLQVTGENPLDLPVPGRKITFGAVKAAQALGDFQVLSQRGRRALRVHLSAPVENRLAELNRALELGLGPA